MSLLTPRFAGLAKRDAERILATSFDLWGEDAERRYRALIATAVADLAGQPDRPGVRPIDARPGLFLYHLRHSRSRTNVPVSHPPHQLVFRVLQTGRIEIVRIVHERVDLPIALRGVPRP